jgi:hypothetical protein
MASLSLRSFGWYRARKGYRLVQPNDSSSLRIFANEFATIPFSPFANADNLYALFARVRSSTELLNFIEKFGPLTHRGFEWVPRNQVELPATIDLNAIPVRPDDEFGRDFQVHDHLEQLFYYSEFGGEEVEKDLEEASFFRRCLELSTSPQRIRSIIAEKRHSFTLRVVPGDGRRTGLDFRVDPGNFLEALRLQLFQKLSGQAHLRSCAYCAHWFEVGPGTGRRLDAKFCTDRHRILFNSLKRSK